jgi:hypothetical protein
MHREKLKQGRYETIAAFAVNAALRETAAK